jgi:uncharacterized protein (TIGR02996 family)
VGKIETAADLLAAVLADPGNDLPRLVLADWWEEHGEPSDVQRAAFVRWQIRTGPVISDWCSVHDARRPITFEMYENCPQGNADQDQPPTPVIRFIWRRGFIRSVFCRLDEWRGGPCPECEGGRRGPWFVGNLEGGEVVYCSTCKGSGRTPALGPALVRQHPVERVTITDREPQSSVQFPRLFRWFSHADGDRSEVGPDLYPFLRSSTSLNLYPWSNTTPKRDSQPYWATRTAALDALSAAAISWAKSTPADAAARGW